jgi:hypothetical protein
MKYILLMLMVIISVSGKTQINTDTVAHKVELNLPKQKHKFFHRGDIAVYSLFFTGGAAEGFNDALWGHNPYPGNHFLDPRISWENKYKSDVPFAKSIMVWTTDADHLSSFVADLSMITAGAISVGICMGDFKGLTKKQKVAYTLKRIGLSLAANKLGHFVVYQVIY